MAQPDNGQVSRTGTIEAAMRRKRAGVAADILTSPVGIPATSTLGGRK